MAKLVATVIITYEVCDADFPGGIREDDILDEERLLRLSVEKAMSDLPGDPLIEDVTINNA